MTLRLNGETRLHLIVGDPIAQVKSPTFLTESFAARGQNAIVMPAYVTADDLPAFMKSVRKMRNLDGLVFTLPHKFAALSYCNTSSERARYAGAVNVMHRQADGTWWGDNTDGHGFVDGLGAEGFTVMDRTVLLIGAGGAGSAIAFEILQRGAALLKIHDIDEVRRERLIALLARKYDRCVGVGSSDPSGVDLVANATPMGMREDDPYPVDVKNLAAEQFVADVITKPEISPLIVYARRLGCMTMPGAGMFNAQSELLVDTLLGQKKST